MFGMNRREFITVLGGAATWPLAARAQQQAVPLIGLLSSRSAAESANHIGAFREGLSQVGYVEGQNVTIDYRWADGRYDQLPILASELVAGRVTAIAAVGGNVSGLAAKPSTRYLSCLSWVMTRSI
jgi:putative tryptophan/tyrosine transport system substrate-binding protein